MSIIICGIGKDGEDYVCPYCGYKSKDIENFATSMCWTCVFAPEDAALDDEPEFIDDEGDEPHGYAVDDPPPWWQ